MPSMLPAAFRCGGGDGHDATRHTLTQQDPNKQVVRVYSVPMSTFESDDEDDTDDDQDEDDDQDQYEQDKN